MKKILTMVVIALGIMVMTNSNTVRAKAKATYKNGVVTITGKGKFSSQKYKNNKKVKKVIVGKNVTKIGNYAFFGCKNLRSVTLQEGVTTIDAFSFSQCESLTDINFPSTLKHIEPEAFKGCTKLSDVVLPDGFEFMDRNAFDGCPLHTTDRDGLRYIPSVSNPIYAFYGLSMSRVPSGTLQLHTGCVTICGTCLPKDKDINLHLLIIPEGVRFMGGDAIYGVKGLKNVDLPSTLIGVSVSPVGYCRSLEEELYDHAYYIGNPSNPHMMLTHLEEKNKAKQITVHPDCRLIAGHAFMFEADNLESLLCCEGLQCIGVDAFTGRSKLKEVFLPSTLRRVPASVLRTSGTSVYIARPEPDYAAEPAFSTNAFIDLGGPVYFAE